ncbi:hypothetical protein [Sinorhizobium medicae]|uniref:hypothetical protein n=1 Tax=Sinorhizobium medicae TaxID=110321 RepID=UPI000FD84C16|nr:hypothetical protein [Sinorhizobium medicae]MQX79836.1 hypothetical protein [Sinorhizobium medicae]RVJ72708.1 hypothetical protein CN168_26605 [Sinorhizobium medicae]
MINYQATSDATSTYRDTANAQALSVNSAADLGNIAAIIRDSAIRVSAPSLVSEVVKIDQQNIGIVR